MSKKNTHVVPVEKGKQWAIKIEGNERAISIHDTQKEAIEVAREIAIKNQAELSIHNRQGKIREKTAMEMILTRQKVNLFIFSFYMDYIVGFVQET